MNERHDDLAASAEQQLADKAHALFDESVQGLDAQTQSRLNRGRQRALAELDSGAGFRTPSKWVPAAGVAAAAVFAVVLWSGKPPVDESSPPATATDLEILLNEDSFEMLEDLEFYSWIDLDAELDAGANVG